MVSDYYIRLSMMKAKKDLQVSQMSKILRPKKHKFSVKKILGKSGGFLSGVLKV